MQISTRMSILPVMLLIAFRQIIITWVLIKQLILTNLQVLKGKANQSLYVNNLRQLLLSPGMWNTEISACFPFTLKHLMNICVYFGYQLSSLLNVCMRDVSVTILLDMNSCTSSSPYSRITLSFIELQIHAGLRIVIGYVYIYMYSNCINS